MKNFIVSIGASGYHAYDGAGVLISTYNIQGAARFSTKEEAKAVAANYVAGSVVAMSEEFFSRRLRIINTSGFPLPKYAKEGDSGMDVRAILPEQKPVTLKPLERYLVPLGLWPEIPLGYEIQIRPKSGLAYKFGITVLNTPGTIDSPYRGEMKANIVNLSNQEYVIEHGAWVAQIVLAKVETMKLIESDELTETERGHGGHGSTGSGLA